MSSDPIRAAIADTVASNLASYAWSQGRSTRV